MNIDHTAIDSYDPFGRPLAKRQLFKRNGIVTSYSISQTYDLAGNVKTVTYPSGRTVNYSYDQAGRLSNFSGNLGGGAAVNYATGIQYDSAGLKSRETYGTQTPLHLKLRYNTRLQLADLRLSSVNDELNWNRGRLSFYYGSNGLAAEDPLATNAQNNGNVLAAFHYAPKDDAISAYSVPMRHDYYYDPLNRITAIRERQRAENGQWVESVSQAFSYDRWGNRTLDLSGGGSGEETVWVDDTVPAGAAQSGGQPGPIISLRSFHGYYVRANNGGGSEVYADAAAIGPHEQFTLVDLNGGALESGDSVQFLAVDNIHYLGARDGGVAPGTPPPGGRIYADAPWGAAWETFTIRKADGASGPIGNNTQISLQSNQGYYVGAESGNGEMYANRTWVATWETFTLVMNGSSSVDESWAWMASNPSPYSGSASHQSVIAAGPHQHYFFNATQTLQVGAGDRLYAYVYLDPGNASSEIMLQWHDGNNWEHRAYWGANQIGWGVDGTESRRYMGPLPPAGQWVRLEVPASAVGLEGGTLNGMAFTLYGGRAWWDKAGKVEPSPLAGAGPPINNNVYTVDTATNRLTSVNGVTMSYDAAGNQINEGSGLRIYDGENRMVEAKNVAGATVSRYIYDADGRRVRRIIGIQETWQVYGIGGELLAEYVADAAASAPQKEYAYRNGQMLVVWDGSETGDRQLQWLVQDHLGSTRMVIDKTGSLAGVRRHDFAPFGEELFAGPGIRSAGNGYSGDLVRQKFGSKERDIETGLDFFGARYYGSLQGRFTSVDPLLSSGNVADPQSWNRYAYTNNNPLRYIDPTGMFKWSADLGGQSDDDKLLADANAIKDKKERQRAIANANRIIGIRTEIRAAIDTANAALADPNSGLSSTQRGQLSRALSAYGEENKTNLNVVLGMWGNPTSSYGATYFGENGNIFVMLGRGHTTDELAAQFAHEGSHVADDRAFNNGVAGSNLTLYQTEQKAFLVGASVAQSRNMESYPLKGLSIYKRGWAEADIRAGIDKILAGRGYEVTSTSQGDRLSAIKPKDIQSVKMLGLR